LPYADLPGSAPRGVHHTSHSRPGRVSCARPWRAINAAGPARHGTAASTRTIDRPPAGLLLLHSSISSTAAIEKGPGEQSSSCVVVVCTTTAYVHTRPSYLHALPPCPTEILLYVLRTCVLKGKADEVM
jgi:hypothetical protein